MNLKELQMAALLHDIGKFSQRAKKTPDIKYKKLSIEEYGYSGAHAKWSATFSLKFTGMKDIEELILYHHNPSDSSYPEMAKIVQKADHHSSKERKKSEKKREVEKEPLISVFSKVKFEESPEPQEYYLPLNSLSMDSLELVKPKPLKAETMQGWNLQPEYKKIWNKFEKEFNSLPNHDNFNTLLFLLKKYTSLIPAAAYVSEPDISLYDHSKTSAALATCMYHYSKENKLKFSDTEKTYLVVSGDISGIQNFIYRVSSPQEARKGMSKRLRGRSIYLNLINDAIVSRIVQELNLNQANILFCGGGHFILIVPNTAPVKTKIEKIKSDVNEMFLKKFNAEIYLALSHLECSGNDLEEFGNIMDELAYKNLQDKRRKFNNVLENLFEDEKSPPYMTCPVCGGELASNNICNECEKQEELGRKIANADYMLKVYSDNQNFDLEALGVGYYFEKDNNQLIKKVQSIISKNMEIEIIRLNNTNFLEIADKIGETENITYGFSFMGNTVPRHSRKGTLYFEHMAQISRGSNKMGILKMDVDNLGKVFSQGLENSSISRISTMSSFLDIFFSGYINNVASKYRVMEDVCDNCKSKVEEIKLEFDENEEKIPIYRETEGKTVCNECQRNIIPTIYINYSGGDDLLVFGPYDDIIRFSEDLKNEFRDWTCKNNDITLSGGIFLAGSKFPVERAVKFADNYLETSKNCGKDRITVFNDVVTWNTQEPYKGFNDLFTFALTLEKLVKSGRISRGMVHSMLIMWQNTFDSDINNINTNKSWKEDLNTRVKRKRYVPLFKYKLRTVKDRMVREELDKDGLKYMPWIKIPASWVSLRMR